MFLHLDERRGSLLKKSATKMVIYGSVILILIFRKSLFHIEEGHSILILDILCGIIGIPCIYGFVLSSLAFLQVVEDGLREKGKKGVLAKTARQYTISSIVELIKENGIIEVLLKKDGKIIRIGAKSDCDSHGVFFDKSYYIGKKDYISIDEFESALYPYQIDETLSVISVDGLDPEKYHLKPL